MNFRKNLFLCCLLGLGWLASAFSVSAGGWDTLKNCRLIAAPGNDGDSFHVQHEGKEYIFRLYFVDTPETSNEFPDRVKDQASYFHLDEKETLKMGNQAEVFTRKFLSGGSFTVWTHWEDARGASSLPRYYALVEKDSKSLIESLTAAGLVRVYGMSVEGSGHPLKVSSGSYINDLKRLENEAQHGHLGAWSRTGKTTVVATQTETPGLPSPVSTAGVSETAVGGKININAATPSELDQIPGIGPVIAQRIIQGRPYKTMEDLVRIQGIGQKTLEKMLPYIRLAD